MQPSIDLSRPFDAGARNTARGIVRHSKSATPHHHEDEKRDRFRAVLEPVAGADQTCIQERMQELLPMAARLLAARWLDRISRSVRLRRGIKPFCARAAGTSSASVRRFLQK